MPEADVTAVDAKQKLRAAATAAFQAGKRGRADRQMVCQFISFDLSNSTAYKRARSDWPLLFSTFYELTWERLRKDDQQFQFWKHLGDEVLVYKEVRSIDDTRRTTEHAFRVLRSVIQSLYAAFPHARAERVSIKGTSWLCLCNEMPTGEMRDARGHFDGDDAPQAIYSRRPYYIDMGANPDFLGPGIDTGFRLSKHAAPGVMVGSLELALVCAGAVSETGPSDRWSSDFRIAGFETLAGIWRGRRYPILWLVSGDNGARVDQAFSYDDLLLYRQQLQVMENQNQPATLQGIAQDVGCWSHVGAIAQHFEQATHPSAGVLRASVRSRNSALEVHCVAVCYSPTRQKCLVAKRLPKRAVIPGTWEFGCAQLQEGEDFPDAAIRGYRSVFGLDIEIQHGVESLLKTYLIASGNKPGLIYAAKIINDQVEPTPNNAKHSELRWVDASAATELAKTEDVVPDFAELIEQTISMHA